MSTVPTKLPSVLTAVSRPTFPPTPLTALVSMRMKNGPTIASSESGTKNRKAEASNEPSASLKSRHQYATGLTISTDRQR